MISHLKQYIIDRMTCSYKFGFIFLLCMVRYIFLGVNVISTLSGITYMNIEKMANKIFIVPKLECLHHNYRVLTYVCLSVELSVFEQDNSRMLCPRIMKFGHNIE